MKVFDFLKIIFEDINETFITILFIIVNTWDYFNKFISKTTKNIFALIIILSIILVLCLRWNYKNE